MLINKPPDPRSDCFRSAKLTKTLQWSPSLYFSGQGHVSEALPKLRLLYQVVPAKSLCIAHVKND